MQLTSEHATSLLPFTKLLMNLSRLGNSNVTTPSQSGPTLCASATTRLFFYQLSVIVSLNLPEFATTLANVTPILVTTSLVVNTKKAKFSFDRSSDPFGWLTATISQHHATWEYAPVQSIHI